MNHRFTIHAEADPQSLPGVIGQLARRWVTPSRLDAQIFGNELLIDFEVAGLCESSAELLRATIGAAVLVRQAALDAVPVPLATMPGGTIAVQR